MAGAGRVMDSGKGPSLGSVRALDAIAGGDGFPGMAGTAEHTNAAGAAHSCQVDQGDDDQQGQADLEQEGSQQRQGGNQWGGGNTR